MVDVSLIIAFIIDGIAQGVVFALLGLTITLVFGLGDILNLSVGIFAVIAVILVSHIHGWVPNLLLAGALGLLIIGVAALLVDRSVLSLVYRSKGEERILVGIFVTLGMLLLLEGLVFVFFPDAYSLSIGISGFSIGGVFIRGSSIAVISLSLIVFALLYLFFDRTYLGQATRTVIQDETGAILCGINPRKMQSLVFILSLLIAGFAGILYSIAFQVDAAESLTLTIYAVITSIVGGVTSITGTVAAGIFLGLVATFTSAYIGAYVAEVVLFMIVVVILLIRPEQIQ